MKFSEDMGYYLLLLLLMVTVVIAVAVTAAVSIARFFMLWLCNNSGFQKDFIYFYFLPAEGETEMRGKGSSWGGGGEKNCCVIGDAMRDENAMNADEGMDEWMGGWRGKMEGAMEQGIAVDKLSFYPAIQIWFFPFISPLPTPLLPPLLPVFLLHYNSCRYWRRRHCGCCHHHLLHRWCFYPATSSVFFLVFNFFSLWSFLIWKRMTSCQRSRFFFIVLLLFFGQSVCYPNTLEVTTERKKLRFLFLLFFDVVHLLWPLFRIYICI